MALTVPQFWQGHQFAVGVASNTRYPTDGIGGSNGTAGNSMLLNKHHVKIVGYVIDVAAAGRIVCVDGAGADIVGTGVTLVAGSLPGVMELPGGGFHYFSQTDANVGIKLAAGITASLVFDLME